MIVMLCHMSQLCMHENTLTGFLRKYLQEAHGALWHCWAPDITTLAITYENLKHLQLSRYTVSRLAASHMLVVIFIQYT